MANKKIEIRPAGGGDYGDILFPKTSADMVVDEANGGTVQQHTSDKNQHIYYRQASGTANTYTISNVVLTDGMGISFKANVTNTGASTLNGISIKNSKGQDVKAGQIVANGIYTVRYNGTNFFLQGAEGGEYGTATAAEVMSGYTVGTENGLVNGSLTLSGNAIATQVLFGQTFYNTDAKTKLSGTMINNNNTTTNATRRATSTGYIDLSPSTGYYDGSINSKTRISDSGFTASNIRSGASIFGLTGSLVGGNYYTSSATLSLVYDANFGLIVSGTLINVGFNPKSFLVTVNSLTDNVGRSYRIVIFGRDDATLFSTYVQDTNGYAMLSVSGSAYVNGSGFVHNYYISGNGGFSVNQSRSVTYHLWSH